MHMRVLNWIILPLLIVEIEKRMSAHSVQYIYHAYHGKWSQMKCTDDTAQLSIGHCITLNNKTIYIFATKCLYFELMGHNVSNPGYIRLPDNISELNDNMCGPMNRKLSL